MRQYKRSDRVGDLIREVISEMILRDLGDPRLQAVTITEVEVTADLKTARVFFSARGEASREESARKGLESAAGVIKKKLGRELRLRYMPELTFLLDRSFDYGSKIDRLIRTLQDEKKDDSPGDR